MDNIEFLREREKSTRESVYRINPCADSDDKFKNMILATADQYKACADELEELRKK